MKDPGKRASSLLAWISALSLLVGAWPSSARAWDTIGATWAAEDLPISWYLASDFEGGTFDDREAEDAIAAAFETWAAVDCAGLSFVYAGRATGALWGVPDGRNVLFFFHDGFPEDDALVSGPSLMTNGDTILEADIAFNGVSYRWATEGADGAAAMDLQGSATHEIGHLLGLWHSTVSDASLNPLLDGNPAARSLADDDIEGICALYEGSGAASAAGHQGDPCSNSNDCAEDLFCLADREDRYCSRLCAEDGACPAGFACYPASGGEAVCAVPEDPGGCACDSPSSDGDAAALVLVLWLLASARRRRARGAGEQRHPPRSAPVSAPASQGVKAGP